VTLVLLDLDQDVWKMYLYSKNAVSRLRLSKVMGLQTGQAHGCDRMQCHAALVRNNIRHWWKLLSVLHITGLPFLLFPHSTVEIGCLSSPSLHVV